MTFHKASFIASGYAKVAKASIEGPCSCRILMKSHGGHIQAIHGRSTHQTDSMPTIERAPPVIFAVH